MNPETLALMRYLMAQPETSVALFVVGFVAGLLVVSLIGSLIR